MWRYNKIIKKESMFFQNNEKIYIRRLQAYSHAIDLGKIWNLINLFHHTSNLGKSYVNVVKNAVHVCGT